MGVDHYVWLLFLESAMSACLCVPMCASMCLFHVWRSGDNFLDCAFLPPFHPMWMPGMEHRLSGLATSPLSAEPPPCPIYIAFNIWQSYLVCCLLIFFISPMICLLNLKVNFITKLPSYRKNKILIIPYPTLPFFFLAKGWGPLPLPPLSLSTSFSFP